MYSFSYLEPVCCSMFSSNCCFLTCIQISQEAGQLVWHSHVFQNFPQFIVIHTVKGFGIVSKARKEIRNLTFVSLAVLSSRKGNSSLNRDCRALAHIVVVLVGVKSVGQISRLKSQKWFLWYPFEAEFLLFLEAKVFTLKTFN